jgi:multicomponent Na+:H+ antiporter subunit D
MNSLIAPIIIPFFAAILLLLWRKPSAIRRSFVTVTFASIFFLCLGITCKIYHGDMLILRLGSWPAPYGITLTVDLLSAIMSTLSSFVALCTILYGFAEVKTAQEHPLRLPLMFFLVAGIHMSFSTGDIFNLFVAFEVMLISSYALMTLEADNFYIKHALPYLTINLFGSTIFLCAAALTYGLLGTLNFADIASKASMHIGNPRLTLIALMYTVVFGIKASMFPLYFWLPKSYPTLPTPLGAFFGGILTKVGVYAFIRLFATILPHELLLPHWFVLVLAAPTMIFGVIGAMSKGFIRGILSYHIISQVGFMLLAVGFFTPLGMAAAIFYIIHHIIVKSSLFLIGGICTSINGTDDLKKMGHLWKVAPIVGILFLFQALSLAGLPPLSGFWGKYLIVLVGLEQKQYIFVVVSIIASILTLVSMLKIWFGAFWQEPKETQLNLSDNRWKRMTAVVVVMTAVSLSIGFGSEIYFRIAEKAANMALNQTAYIQAVLQLP